MMKLLLQTAEPQRRTFAIIGDFSIVVKKDRTTILRLRYCLSRRVNLYMLPLVA